MRPTFFKAAALTALASLASASDVIDLTKDSFAATAGGSLSLIEFFAPVRLSCCSSLALC